MAPARAAYSHSASVRSRYSLLVNRESQPTYCMVSPQLTLIAGIFPRPQRSGTRGQAVAATHASHSSNVTSNLEAANGLAIVTLCCGPSLSTRSGSLSGETIVKLPAGTTTISGQSGQSLKLCPALELSSDLACVAAESTNAAKT